MEFAVYKDKNNHDVVFRVIEVTECEELGCVDVDGCPFNYDTISCRAKTILNPNGEHRPDLDKCPLKKEQIIIKLKANNG